ncbi:MAG: VCBS repeat-containing protein, partial [Myxococcota bacterium]
MLERIKRLPWDRIPDRHDPRWAFLAILAAYIVLGITTLGFNRSPIQILFTIGFAAGLDMVFHALFRRRTLLFPLSAVISALSLCILMNYAHGTFYVALPVFLMVASKYLFTFNARHVYNPSLFGIVGSLLLANEMISVSPAYQWGGSLAMVFFVVTAALTLFVFKIKRNALILSFLLFYGANLAFRAMLTQHHVPPETLFMGALTSPAFYLFTFFMIVDPGTSPKSPKLQVAMGFLLAVFDLVLHTFQTLNTLFFAAFILFSSKLVFLHGRALLHDPRGRILKLRRSLAVAAPTLTLVALGVWGTGKRNVIAPPAFRFVAIEEPGFSSRPSRLLDEVDPKIANVGKWLLSVGDAAAVADVDGDGLQDVFLTQPLKDSRDRAALYLNRGQFVFERVDVPVLEPLRSDPAAHGLVSGALFYDYDNDADQDLFVSVGYGRSRLLVNRLVETGRLAFEDVSADVGIVHHTVSVSANVLDVNADGRLDLIVANAVTPYLDGYETPTPFNIFDLPEPAFDGDRRMLNVMHRSWHDANNAGENHVYLATDTGYVLQDYETLGFSGRRWTIDVATGDVNGDGATDLYFANDFGPDELYLNRGGRFEAVRGRLVGQLGRDTYKGMNATMGDVDGD